MLINSLGHATNYATLVLVVIDLDSADSVSILYTTRCTSCSKLCRNSNRLRDQVVATFLEKVSHTQRSGDNSASQECMRSPTRLWETRSARRWRHTAHEGIKARPPVLVRRRVPNPNGGEVQAPGRRYLGTPQAMRVSRGMRIHVILV